MNGPARCICRRSSTSLECPLHGFKPGGKNKSLQPEPKVREPLVVYIGNQDLEECGKDIDLGEWMAASISLYPHKSMLEQITKFVEASALTRAEAEIERLRKIYDGDYLRQVEQERDEWRAKYECEPCDGCTKGGAEMVRLWDENAKLQRRCEELSLRLHECNMNSRAPMTNTGWPHEKKLHEQLSASQARVADLTEQVERVREETLNLRDHMRDDLREERDAALKRIQELEAELAKNR